MAAAIFGYRLIANAMRTRHFSLLATIYFIWFLAIAIRLFYWQVSATEHFQSFQPISKQGLMVQPRRGRIFSSDNFSLVANKKGYLVFLWRPNLKIKFNNLLKKISPVIYYRESKKKQEHDQKLLKRIIAGVPGQQWLALKHHLTYGQYQALRDLHISGLGFRAEMERFYPEGSMAAHLLGFVGSDKVGRPQGYFGLEGFYQNQLVGLAGIRPPSRFWGFLEGKSHQLPPHDGRDLYLFLDRGAQFIAERALAKGIRQYGAKEGWVVILDSRKGTVLAMASWPKYDPADYSRYPYQRFVNPVISAAFEPGSILKPLVMAAALNEKVVTPETQCPICAGPLKIGEYTIKTWNNVYHPQITMTGVIKDSDNVGMAFVSQRLGKKKLFKYFEQLYLTRKTGIDLQGEMVPPLKPGDEWYPIDLATAAFGQGIAVTPIQFTVAFNALANGGVVLRPRVVKEIKDGSQVFYTKADVLSRPFSKQTNQEIKQMLVTAVNEGEAKWTRLKGYRIAGKTGTAQIPIKGHYAEKKTIASFVGFAPADKPRFTMLVSLREPSSSPWGSETAAPLWFHIAKALFVYWGIQPNGN